MLTASLTVSGELYIHVDPRTTVAPTRKDGVIVTSKMATEARNERTIERDVANPLRMLSEYLVSLSYN